MPRGAPAGRSNSGPYSAGDPDAAAAVLNTGRGLEHPRCHVRARDLLRHAPLGSLGKYRYRSARRTVGKHARGDDGPVEIALAEHLLADAVVLDDRTDDEAREEPAHGVQTITLDRKRREHNDPANSRLAGSCD